MGQAEEPRHGPTGKGENPGQEDEARHHRIADSRARSSNVRSQRTRRPNRPIRRGGPVGVLVIPVTCLMFLVDVFSDLIWAADTARTRSMS